MSQLEKLPAELLEQVYLHAMNINLPRASPIIGAKLSSDSIYHKTVMAAFSPTWNYWRKRGSDYGVADRGLQFLDADRGDHPSWRDGAKHLPGFADLSFSDYGDFIVSFQVSESKAFLLLRTDP